MTCVLCDSWAHCPVNPASLHPQKRSVVTAQDVEVALLTGFLWGNVAGAEIKLCDDHRTMHAEFKTKLLRTQS